MSENMTIAEARAAERERIKSILTDPIAQDRRQAAEALAFGSSMGATEAITLLATLEVGAPKATVTGMRSADAPGGLVTMGEAPKLAPGEALVSTLPSRPQTETPAKRLWRSAIAGVNSSAAATKADQSGA